MSLSLLKFFRKKTEVDPSVAPATPAAIEKPASERLGRTVRPNVVRAIESEVSPVAATPLAPPSLRSFSTPDASRRRTISLGENPAPVAAPSIPPPEPASERTVALSLNQLLPQIPPELLAQSQVDPAQRVVFSAVELEHGMANGRPSVSLHSLYRQAPTIFAGEVPPGDQREIMLPFDQVLEQFANFQVRGDQENEEVGPHFETPFSQVATLDRERFRAPLPAPLQAAPPATVVLPHAPAPTPPPLAPIRLAVLTVAPVPPPPVAAPELPNEPPAIPPLVPESLSPNGTGAPATERVPASSGSPVPIPLPAPFAPPPPARIAFKITPPASDLCPPPQTLPPTPAAEIAPLIFSGDGPRIKLSLREILREIPPFQFTGNLDDIPESAEIELPFAIIEPQLSLGKVGISPAQFHAAMPEEFRALFHLDEGGLPVTLPLPEVLRRLPNESLKLRRDQEEAVLAQIFETPFSRKAAEDALRLQVPATPIAKNLQTFSEPPPAQPGPIAEPASVAEPEVEVAAAASTIDAPIPGPQATEPISFPEEPALPQESAPPIQRTPLQSILETDEAVDAKSVVALVSSLPGISACAVVFSDGLSLAGNLPPEDGADALCAMAPEIFKRLGAQMTGAHFGKLQSVTLFCEQRPVSFFTHGDICLAAVHSEAEIGVEIRQRLGQITEELAHIYREAPIA